MQQDSVNTVMRADIINRLRSFNANLKLQQVVLTLMVHQLISADEMDDQKKIFSLLDTNKDGMLQREELIAAFQEVYGKVVEAEVDEIMALIDLNGNGVIDYSEWLVATVKIEEIVKVKKLKMAFQYFDRDSKGNITLEDIKGVMANSGIQQNEGLDEQVFKDILGEADENGDGVIDFEEFKTMMSKLVVSNANDGINRGQPFKKILPVDNMDQVD